MTGIKWSSPANPGAWLLTPTSRPHVRPPTIPLLLWLVWVEVRLVRGGGGRRGERGRRRMSVMNRLGHLVSHIDHGVSVGADEVCGRVGAPAPAAARIKAHERPSSDKCRNLTPPQNLTPPCVNPSLVCLGVWVVLRVRDGSRWRREGRGSEEGGEVEPPSTIPGSSCPSLGMRLR